MCIRDRSNTVRHLVVGAGKDGNIYVVNRDAMGKFNASANQIWQELDGALPGGVWSTPAYFNNTVYYADVGGSLKAFGISSAKLSSAPTSQTSTSFAYPGTSPSVSANGTSNAILWSAENASPAVLHAYDATNLARELYNSNQAVSYTHLDVYKRQTPAAPVRAQKLHLSERRSRKHAARTARPSTAAGCTAWRLTSSAQTPSALINQMPPSRRRRLAT